MGDQDKSKSELDDSNTLSLCFVNFHQSFVLEHFVYLLAQMLSVPTYLPEARTKHSIRDIFCLLNFA